jgi:hypothetical protein
MSRRSSSGGKVFVGLVLGAVTVLGAFAIGYWRLVHYSRSAAFHLPAGTHFAVRLDVEQVVLFEPLRKNLFPVLTEGRAPGVLARVEAATGVNPAMDLREVLFAIGPAGEWTFLVGGLFPKDLTSGVAQVLDGEGVKSCALRGQRLHCTAPELWLAQAPDNLLVVASSEAQLARAIERSDTHKTLGFPVTGAGALVATSAQFGPWLENPLLGLLPGVRTLSQVRRVNGDLRLAERAEVRLRLLPEAGLDVQTLQSQAEQALAALKGLSNLVPGDGMLGGRPFLSRATVSVEGGAALLSSHYTQTELDLTARAVAASLREWLAVVR